MAKKRETDKNFLEPYSVISFDPRRQGSGIKSWH